MILQLRFIIYKYSERREKSISSLLEYALPSRILYYVNIVKGERKAYQVYLNMLCRAASYIGHQSNIVKGESRAERKSKILFKAMPSRILSWTVVKYKKVSMINRYWNAG